MNKRKRVAQLKQRRRRKKLKERKKAQVNIFFCSTLLDGTAIIHN